jgi:hypothetical protein
VGLPVRFAAPNPQRQGRGRVTVVNSRSHKQCDYGWQSNPRAISAERPVSAPLVRLPDKWQTVIRLAQGQPPANSTSSVGTPNAAGFSQAMVALTPSQLAEKCVNAVILSEARILRSDALYRSAQFASRRILSGRRISLCSKTHGMISDSSRSIPEFPANRLFPQADKPSPI